MESGEVALVSWSAVSARVKMLDGARFALGSLSGYEGVGATLKRNKNPNCASFDIISPQFDLTLWLVASTLAFWATPFCGFIFCQLESRVAE
ncbi:hypothetical protein VNO80_10019 [Phaseolus coccineus]|uniref:Uncharacterized protein n=1 Tax=Phaseolus coccineus TaxID=3886 RepID=A0AAN9RDF4_PHACN